MACRRPIFPSATASGWSASEILAPAALRSGDTSLVQRHMTLAAQLAAHLEAGLNDAESMAEMFQCECDKCEVCSQAAATAANLDVTIEQIRTGQWDCELKSNQ